MEFRKERSLALLAGHGAGLLLSSQTWLAEMQKKEMVFGEGRVFALAMMLFGVGTLLSFVALSQAGEKTGNKKLYAVFEIGAIIVLATIIVLALNVSFGFSNTVEG